MHWKSSVVLGLLLCIAQSGVLGISLFNFWSHILPGGAKDSPALTSNSSSENSVISSAEDESVGSLKNAPPDIISSIELDGLSGEQSKITQLLNPMTWFRKTKKENTFQINAELGTVSALLFTTTCNVCWRRWHSIYPSPWCD